VEEMINVIERGFDRVKPGEKKFVVF